MTDGDTRHCRSVIPINSPRPALNYALRHGNKLEIELKLHTFLVLAVVHCFSNFLVPRTICRVLTKCTHRPSIHDLRLWNTKTQLADPWLSSDVTALHHYSTQTDFLWYWKYWTQILKHLTPFSRILHVKLGVLQPFKKFPALYGTRWFIPTFMSAWHLSQFWAISIQWMPPSHFLKLHLNIILSYMPGRSRWYLSIRSPHQNPVGITPVHHTCHMPRPANYWFDHPNSIWSGINCVNPSLIVFSTFLLHPPC